MFRMDSTTEFFKCEHYKFWKYLKILAKTRVGFERLDPVLRYLRRHIDYTTGLNSELIKMAFKS